MSQNESSLLQIAGPGDLLIAMTTEGHCLPLITMHQAGDTASLCGLTGREGLIYRSTDGLTTGAQPQQRTRLESPAN